MITIYNETTTPWKASEVNNGKAILLKKVKERGKEDGTKAHKAIAIIAYKSLFDGDTDKLNKLLGETVHRKNKAANGRISDRITGINFNQKEFKPIIQERNDHDKELVLGSLFLKGKRVINAHNNNAFLLDCYIFGGEFTFILSLNNKDSKFVIDLEDHETKKITEYSFRLGKDNEVVIKITKKEKAEATQYPVKIFRPARPTYTILAKKNEIPLVEKLVDKTHYSIIEYDESTFESVVSKLYSDRYRAVTLYTPVWKPDDKEIKHVEKLKKQFYIVYRIHKNGKIEKVKF